MENENIYKILLRSAMEGTITAVREAASRIFGSAVSVTDNSFRVLSADIDPGSTDDMLERSKDSVYVSESLLQLFKEHNLISNLAARPHETIVVDWGYFSEHPHITTGIFWEGSILGSITVLVDSADYTPEQDETLQACADALALVMHNAEYGRKIPASDRDYFISRLFHGAATQKDIAAAEKNGVFRQCRQYIVLATEFLPDSVLRKIEANGSRVLIFQNDNITYLMADPRSRELKEMQKWIAGRGYRYGLSYPFNNPLLAGKMARQAASALHFGSRSHDKKAEWSFPEYALEILVHSTADAADFIHPGIPEMEFYDLQNNTQYLSTLKEWLRHGMDYSATAKAMNLHRNSLYYRMQRIQELFGIEINDMNTGVQLYLTLCTNNLW